MSKAGERLIEGAKEALAVAKGAKPAARLHVNGHAYVPLEQFNRVRGALAACEAAMAIVEPRNSKALYLEVLADARAALQDPAV